VSAGRDFHASASPGAGRRERRAPARRAARPWRALRGAAVIALLAVVAGCNRHEERLVTFDPPDVGGAEVGDPSLAVDAASGDLLLTWLAGDSTDVRLWFARSADAGVSWSTPVAVTPEGEPLRIHPESSPKLVRDGRGRVGVAYTTSVEVPGRRFPASDLRFARSEDGGRTWSSPATVNDDAAAGPGSHTFFDVVADPAGGLVAAWLDSRPGGDGLEAEEAEGHDASIHLARSSDFGTTWGVNEAHWSRVCPCCRAGVALEPTGTPVVTFRKHYSGQVRDVVVARVGGGAPERVHEDAWVQGGCPHSGPPIEIAADGSRRVAWFTGADGRAGVWFQQLAEGVADSTRAPLPVLVSERLPTVHVALALAGDRGTLVACDADSTGARRLSLARIAPDGSRVVERFTTAVRGSLSHPRLAVSPGRDVAYVAWSARDGERGRIGLARWRLTE